MRIEKTLKYENCVFNAEGTILHVKYDAKGITVEDAVILPAVNWDSTIGVIGGTGYVTLTVDGDPADCVGLIKKVEEAIDKMIIKIEFTLDLVS